MYRVTKGCLIGICALVLASCTDRQTRHGSQIEYSSGHQLAKAEQVTPEGSEFNVALYKEYLNLAQIEAAEQDFSDADVFALRALQSGTGTPVQPEHLDERPWMPSNKAGELSEARERLVWALTTGGRDKAPGPAARAQAMFDCWMEEQEENIHPKDIKACKDAFDKSMEEMADAMMEAPKPMAQPAPAPPPPAPPSAPIVEGLYIVYFEFDKSDITAEAQQVLDEVVADFEVDNPPAIRIEGHTDLAGSDAYNDALSQRRARSVVENLGAAGLPSDVMQSSAFGESKPLRQTPDGQREERNRRVEIIFE